MEMSILSALAQKCETADGPNIMLEHEVRVAVFPEHWDLQVQRFKRESPIAPRVNEGDYLGYLPPAPYSASLDAAETLVPEGWDWSAGTGGCGSGGHAYLVRHAPIGREIEADGATPALALCAAALRAREDSTS